MPLLTVSPENQARLAVLVPIVALALSVFVVYPAWGRHGDLEKELDQNRQELNELKAKVIPEPGPVRPAVDETPAEPAQFLKAVTDMATAARLDITGFDLTTSEGKESGEVRPVNAKIEVEGQYYQVRDFLYQLARANRMLAVTDITVTGQNVSSPAAGTAPPAPVKPLHASITIERYVAPPGGAA